MAAATEMIIVRVVVAAQSAQIAPAPLGEPAGRSYLGVTTPRGDGTDMTAAGAMGLQLPHSRDFLVAVLAHRCRCAQEAAEPRQQDFILQLRKIHAPLLADKIHP